MYNRLIEFVEKYDILYCCQLGFWKNHSTSLASIHLINKISSEVDRHENTAGVFLDLSKACDTIDHQILFGKLEHYVVLALEWIRSYFSRCKQFVQTIKCGVPQGSILGPLFILCINDLSHASQ